jgi:mono/diheme cytochrome c family protein
MKSSIYIVFFCLFVSSCQTSYEEPKISLKDYKIENGFELQLIASEPLLIAPVAMDFDAKGRIWVADMPGFMNNLEGKGEDRPTGSIKILEDLDGDGVMDHSKTFLDSLVMPRALALVYGGLLYVEPPNLWFMEIDGDRPGKRTLVDSTYAQEGNPEYQPNGLKLNIDNWIYNAKLNYRYQLKNGKWLKEPTSLRGQWGISHDNFGRLYYNTNSKQLIGDYVLPNRFVRNKFQTPKNGVNRLLTTDQRVYPINNAAVNRGYAASVLNSDSLLINFSAACAPLVYRGGAFPAGYGQNVFVCSPEANLIKRNILTFHGDSTSAEQAWQGKEFLASTDEGFRPVNLSDGPDGAMYVVDMHRGVIQHYAFLSPYLKKKAKREQLDTLVDYGRILKITNQDAVPTKNPDFEDLSASELVELLSDKNGWIRDRAQHYLIFKDKKEAVTALKKLSKDGQNPLAQVHALYALQGLEALSFDLLKEVVQNSGSEVVSHAIVLMEGFVSEGNAAEANGIFQSLMAKSDPGIDLYLATTFGTWADVAPGDFAPLIYSLFQKYRDNALITEALVSGSGKTVDTLAAFLGQYPDFKGSDLQEQMAQNIALQKEDKLNPIFTTTVFDMDTRTKGAKLFRQICAACHSIDGAGIDDLAPPFVNSEYLSGPVERIGLIVLHGLKGPVHVDGKLYETDQVMPGLANNESLTDRDISDVIAYVTNSFSRSSKYLGPEKVKELRKLTPKDEEAYTEKELMEYIKTLR